MTRLLPDTTTLRYTCPMVDGKMDSASSLEENDVRNECKPNVNRANDDDANLNDTQPVNENDKKIPAASLSSSSHTDEAIARRFQKSEAWNDRLDRHDDELPPSLEPPSLPSSQCQDDTDGNECERQSQEGDRRLEWKDRLRQEEQTLAALAQAQQFHNAYDDLSDEELAKSLQDQEFAPLDPTKIEERKQAEERAMQESVDGRAWLFVEQVVDLHAKLSESMSISGLSTVAVDDMVFLCKPLLQCANDFQNRGIPSRVSLVYHYTKRDCMNGIREHGLMTLGDRKQKDAASSGRASFGDGVYAASNPTAFRHFGDIGMLVAVILGNKQRVTYDNSGATPNYATSANTLIGNKRISNIHGDISLQDRFADELVLQESRQCLPLIQFDSNLTRSDEGRASIWTYHQELQQLCDKALNGGKRTVLKRTLLPAATVTPKAPTTVGIYIAPKTLPTDLPTDTFEKVPWKSRPSSDSFCAICRDSLCRDSIRWNLKPVVCLKVCGHLYHKSCLEESLQAYPNCPTCRAVVRKPQGRSPSGAMSVSLMAVPCKGFEQSSDKSIVITYTIPSGIQKPYHENPGEPFPETTRVAYLPNNPEGRKLLKRLKNAFMQGLTFTVGTSLTTGKPNSVIWASIHHKTSSSGGAHGFPDPTYFARCNTELDSLGVPP